MTPIIKIVRSYHGCSNNHDRDRLGALVSRGVDDPEVMMRWRGTNCGLFALGVLHEAGLNHEILRRRYVTAMAITWLFKVAIDLGVHDKFTGDMSVLHPGQLLHYATPGKSDDHVEFLLGPVDKLGVADHGGGGRQDNSITCTRGTILSSWGRPLRYVLDFPTALEAQQVYP